MDSDEVESTRMEKGHARLDSTEEHLSPNGGNITIEASSMASPNTPAETAVVAEHHETTQNGTKEATTSASQNQTPLPITAGLPPRVMPGIYPNQVPVVYPQLGFSPALTFPTPFSIQPYPTFPVPLTPVVYPATQPFRPPAPQSPTPITSLTQDQRDRLEQAKKYAKEITAQLLGQKAIAAAFSSLPASSPTAASLVLGAEGRSIAVLSRIYVGSINFELTDNDIRQVFSEFGSVKAVSMTMDATTGKHKGYCFVEYDFPEAAQMALETMNGFELGGRQLKVGRPNNYSISILQTLPPAPPNRIYVSNIHEVVSEDNVEEIFKAFGDIKKCSLLPDPLTRKHQGCGYIEFTDETAATTAVEAMNQFPLGGIRLHVRKVVVGGKMPEGMASIANLPPVEDAVLRANAVVHAAQGSAAGGFRALPKNVVNVVNNIAVKAGSAVRLPSGLASTIQRVNEESVSLEENMYVAGSSQRYALMQKLQRREDLASNVIVLRNMVTPDEIDEDLQGEISGECSKFGAVLKVAIHALDGAKTAQDVSIYVQFQAAPSAEKAVAGLNGRWFSGKMIQAQISDVKTFEGILEKLGA
ncbi:hypothetical protein BJ742DRAFT_858067 [Cladochytrium replicatum]|nr:hypothetical protein BJ742DRAFT_858067 [Cladochytrium replicatum]